MAISAKLIAGAVIAFLGLVAVSYSMSVLSKAATNGQIAFKESDVQPVPNAVKIYFPVVVAGTGGLVAGIALIGVGLSETLSPTARAKPTTTRSGRSESTEAA